MNMFRKSYHYRGISVFVPESLNVIPVKQKFPDIKGPWTTRFQMIRPVANIAFYDPEDKELTDPIKEFDPPIELRIGYTIEDII
jgi:hypothetical protein